MDSNLLTILSLLWVAYIFIFAECDRIFADLVKRLIVSHSVGEQGLINVNEIHARQIWTFREIYDYSLSLEESPAKNATLKVKKFYDDLVIKKHWALVNLFCVTALAILVTGGVIGDFWRNWLVYHEIFSFIGAFLLHGFANTLAEEPFLRFIKKSSP